MRTTTEVIEAARMGEQCTEEELRLCIISMRTTAVLSHIDHARWACDESLPLRVQLLAKSHWKAINYGWNVPLDIRVPPEDRPGHPSLEQRRRLANAIFDAAQKTGKSNE